MNVKQAMINPSSVFASPGDIFYEKSLTREQKIKILHRWALRVARRFEVPDG